MKDQKRNKVLEIAKAKLRLTCDNTELFGCLTYAEMVELEKIGMKLKETNSYQVNHAREEMKKGLCSQICTYWYLPKNSEYVKQKHDPAVKRRS